MKLQAWLASASLVLGGLLVGHAQSLSPSGSSTDQLDTDETVYLSPFEVSSDRVSGYTVTDSAAARIRRELIDTPTSIQVVTSEFMNDIGAATVLDAIQYLSGVSVPPTGGLVGTNDRQVIRGFEVVGITVDNFTPGTADSSFDPAVVDRVEVIKGPSAIHSPNGPPGGAGNLLTKSPKFSDPSYTISAELADEYFGNKGVIDATGRVPSTESFAYRVIGTYRDAHSYWPGRILSKSINPMLTWAISEKIQLKVKGFLNDWENRGAAASSVPLANDFPIDGTVSSSLDDYRPGYEFYKANGSTLWPFRGEKIRRVTGEFTIPLGDHLNLRLAGLKEYRHWQSISGGMSVRMKDLGNRVDPVSGKWTETLRWDLLDPSLPYDKDFNYYVSTPIDFVSNVRDVVLSENASHNWSEGINYQADLAGKFGFGGSDSEPLVGFSFMAGTSRRKAKNRYKAWNMPPEDITGAYDLNYHFNTRYFLPDPPRPTKLPWEGQGLPAPRQYWADNETFRGTNTQYYINAQLDTFKGRVLWSGGLSYQERENDFGDHLRGTRSRTKDSRNAPSYAVLFKLRPNASVYAAHSENSNGGSWYAGPVLGNQPISRDGIQDELGLKFSFFNRRLSITTSYFEVKQTNIAREDPRNAELPPGAERIYPDQLLDITNEGVELDISGQVTTNLTVLGSVTSQKKRDEFGRKNASVPDTMLNGLAQYKFSQGSLKGFGVHVGFNHVGKTTGENPPAERTPLNVLRTAGFYLPSRTIYNAGLSYQRGIARFQVNIDNLTDVVKPALSENRYGIGLTAPRNIRLTTTLTF